MSPYEKIAWSVQEYEHKEKSTGWYIALGIIAISITIASFLLGNTLFSVLILVGTFTLAMYSMKKPEIMEIELRKQGILISGRIYQYNTLESFWVEEYDKEPKIIIQSEKTLMPYIIIPLGDADPDKVREFLFEYIEEEEHHEPWSYKLMEYLGF
ncbi:hypothetical protein MNBD_BACTEROID05-318 [hydrothermal vent metagenome]|uniref:DUF5673 domain-containing protein n=1 Tax=hydrothermal vent metagenome TaxID=652676 RepID=A0A3B0TJH1_9ZZZZ